MNPTARPTQRKPKRIKALIRYVDCIGRLHPRKNNGNTSYPVAVIDVSDEAALIEQAGPIIQQFVGYFNGWAVSKEQEAKECRDAAKALFQHFGLITRKRTRK